MKAKIIIENGTSQIILHAENEFEKQLIENAKDSENLKSSVYFEYDTDHYGRYPKDHKILIELVTLSTQ